MNNSSITYHSHHYFIGKRLKKSDAMKIRDVQQDIQNKNEFLEPQDKINNIYSPYIYLGYFNERIEGKLKQLILPELYAIAEKFGPLRCSLRGYSLTGQSRNYKYVGLTYETPHNYLEEIIIPYLKSYLDDYTGINLTYENIPMVPLYRLRRKKIDQFLKNNPHSTNNKGKVAFSNYRLPSIGYNKKSGSKFFDIDSIDLLRATPVTVRKGKSSLNEQLHIDTVFQIPLAGTL